MVYKAGDTISRTDTSMWIYGTLTTANTDIFMFIPINKPIIGNINFKLLAITVRQNGNYLFDSNSNDDSDINIVVLNFPHSGLYLLLHKNDGWGGTNNDIVSVMIRFEATIS